MCSCLYLGSAGHYFCVCMTVFLISGARGFLSLLPKGPQPATSAVCGTEPRCLWLAVWQTQPFGTGTPKPGSPGHSAGKRMGRLASISGCKQNLGCVLTPLSWHCCHQPVFTFREVPNWGCRGAVGHMGQTWGHRGVPTSQGSHPTLPPAGNWPCEQ